MQKIGIRHIDVINGERVAESVRSGAGVLILPNHSFHYDSYVLIESGIRHGWFMHFMSAWQVFALAGWVGKHLLQRHGVFSINREGTDTKAFREAVSILSNGRHPLVIFPEGDLYHSNDRVMPFREGAAAIALSVARKGTRPIHVIPAVMKCFYTQDPTSELVEMMSKLEHRIRWRPRPDLPLVERIYRFGNGFLASKEIEYAGRTFPGELPDRLRGLAGYVLDRVRVDCQMKLRGGDIIEQIRNVRGTLIRDIERTQKTLNENGPTAELLSQADLLQRSLQDMFFVTQLTSYRGEYTAEKPTVERMAETIDKFEEDVFELQYPTPRGKRRAVVEFGEIIDLSAQSFSTSELTKLAEQRVQSLMDSVNESESAA